MKKIIVENGKVFICEEITANCNKSYIKTSLTIDVDKLILALQKRMENCVNKLQEAYVTQSIIETSETTISYISGCFNFQSYCMMEETVQYLQNIKDTKDVTFINIEDLQNLNCLQLNQLKKAVINFDKNWTQLASAIEDIEMFKVSILAEI